jgi:hypothetical protein
MMPNKHVVVAQAKGLSIDGQTRPAGNYHIQEFEDDEWTGGCYATLENLAEKIKEALENE